MRRFLQVPNKVCFRIEIFHFKSKSISQAVIIEHRQVFVISKVNTHVSIRTAYPCTHLHPSYGCTGCTFFLIFGSKHIFQVPKAVLLCFEQKKKKKKKKKKEIFYIN